MDLERRQNRTQNIQYKMIQTRGKIFKLHQLSHFQNRRGEASQLMHTPFNTYISIQKGVP